MRRLAVLVAPAQDYLVTSRVSAPQLLVPDASVWIVAIQPSQTIAPVWSTRPLTLAPERQVNYWYTK